MMPPFTPDRLRDAIGFVLLFAILLADASPARSIELRPFTARSMEAIAAAQHGTPYVLVLWSVDCAHCPEELATLAAARRTHPQLRLVLVSIDGPGAADTILAALSRHGLEMQESWVFADSFVERLRYAIDPRWHGELPRTYLVDADGTRTARSGMLPAGVLEEWIVHHYPPRP